MRRISLYAMMGIAVLVVSVSSTHASLLDPNDSALNCANHEIRVATYNVENLFDTVHDADKNDWNYLPLGTPGKVEGCHAGSSRYRQICLETDWTQSRLNIKLHQIKSVFAAAGGLPDVLGVQEVENAQVLSLLKDVLGYDRFILEEGPDRRGIDVGILFNEDKLEYLEHKSYRLTGPEFESKPTRDILAVFFKARRSSSDAVLGVYVNHWPSQAAPAPKRVATAERLKSFIDRDMARYQGRLHVVALGDFNTVDSDWPHPFKAVIQHESWGNHLINAREWAKKKRALPKSLPMGSYFYVREMSWQHLDHIFLSRNLVDKMGFEMVISSFRILNPAHILFTFEYNREDLPGFGTKITEVPRRSNHNGSTPQEAGYSDHLPVSLKIRL
jgi:exonuclease III